MKLWTAGRSLVGSFLLVLAAGCATIPPAGIDGVAVECTACDTVWIRLDRPRELAGIYRIQHDATREVCPDCEKLARQFLRTGQAPAQCSSCGGMLIPGEVQLTTAGEGPGGAPQ